MPDKHEGNNEKLIYQLVRLRGAYGKLRATRSP